MIASIFLPCVSISKAAHLRLEVPVTSNGVGTEPPGNNRTPRIVDSRSKTGVVSSPGGSPVVLTITSVNFLMPSIDKDSANCSNNSAIVVPISTSAI